MIQIRQKEDCCGCNACGDICPKDAITFQTDEEGFWYSIVDQKKCINCSLCEKVCPVLHAEELKKNDFEQPICYAAENKNLEVVFDSTSGGLFSALADYTYRQGGYVGGAVFNEDFSVSHFISKNSDDLLRLRSSKYEQSNAKGFYKKVKELVEAGERVLICGTPCQMAAMKAYLGHKEGRNEYPNILIVDFICLGVNSPLVTKRYRDFIEEKYGSRIIYSKAKSKEYGWRNLTAKFILEDGREVFQIKDNNPATKGYIGTHLFCRPSCYDCKFKGFPRIADISLADFWGIENFNKSMEKNLGTSLVLINSKKGQTYFEGINPKVNFIQMPFETILPGNKALVESISKFNNDRTGFFRDVKTMAFDEVVEKYSVAQSSKDRIKNLIRKALRKCKIVARFVKNFIRITRLHPPAVFNTIRYSGLLNLLHGKGILFSTYCTVNIAKNVKLELDGLLIIGGKDRFPRSKLETRFLIADGGKLTVLGDYGLGYGSDIEIHEGGHLILRGKRYLSCGSNMCTTIICKEKIDIGKDVEIGRNVTIRDNNGGHYINRKGYKNSRPVIIGEKAWLGESCTVMSGVKIGNGAIICARAFVVGPVSAHSMVAGIPTRVIDKDVLWKY